MGIMFKAHSIKNDVLHIVKKHNGYYVVYVGRKNKWLAFLRRRAGKKHNKTDLLKNITKRPFFAMPYFRLFVCNLF